MTKQEYIREIVKGLDLKKSEKKRIEADLDSDIQAALEQGESMEEIMRRIGDPEEVAEEFMSGTSSRPMRPDILRCLNLCFLPV